MMISILESPLVKKSFRIGSFFEKKSTNQVGIGYGSSAVVYEAVYKPLKKRVAIKMIDLDMFERNQIDELRVFIIQLYTLQIG
jgi:hypothetical protein